MIMSELTGKQFRVDSPRTATAKAQKAAEVQRHLEEKIH
jgi:hypothetical protein